MSAALPSPQVIPEETVNGQRGKARRILLTLAAIAADRRYMGRLVVDYRAFYRDHR